jgi:uncharacterized protein YjbI with pentapeptide repeats
MALYSKEQVLEKVRKGESLERADLKDLDLDRGLFENANLERADLEGVMLEAGLLRKANLSCANLREAYLANADLREANLQKADLEGANLDGANLSFADLSYANLDGANLEGANLNGAHLSYAQLGLANLGGASLEGAQLAHADLSECYLGGAKLVSANLEHARMEKANLEEADLTGASLVGAILDQACGEGANFAASVLQGATLRGAWLARANLSMADLRQCDLLNAKLTKAILTGTKVFGIEATSDQLTEVLADWVDFSAEGNGQVEIKGADLVECYNRVRKGLAATSTALSDQPKRFFGQGDVLRNATLEFVEKSQIEIESSLEKCTITLGTGTILTIGPKGVLTGCQIIGGGEIVVHGKFYQNGVSPGIKDPSRLIVGKTGVVSGVVKQPLSLTQFSFEHGCSLDLKILKAQ